MDKFNILDQFSGLIEPVPDPSGSTGGGTETIQNSIVAIVNGIIGILGIVCVLFVLVGGITYLTSAGDPAKVEKGKKTILYALIGLAICALSYVIVNWFIGVLNTPA